MRRYRVVKRPGDNEVAEPMKRLHLVGRTIREVAELTGLTQPCVRRYEHQALCKLIGGLAADSDFCALLKQLSE